MKRNFILFLVVGLLTITVACEPKKSAEEKTVASSDTIQVKADTTVITEPVQDSSLTK